MTERQVDWSWHRIGYLEACRRFTPEARALLLAFAALGVAYGVFTTLFTLYLVALGFDEAFIGVLTAVSALSGALASIPAGMLYDRLGPRPALLTGLIASASGIGIECVVREPLLLLAGGAVAATGVALLLIAQAPLMAAVSSERERTHLYGIAAAVGVLASVAGNAYAGFMPGFLAQWEVDRASVYRFVLISGCAPAVLAFSVAWRLRIPAAATRGEGLALVASCRHPAVWRLLVTGVALATGGGMVLPFLNVYLIRTYEVDSEAVALVRAAGIAAMASGGLVAPLLASRVGLIHGIVLGRLASAPWLLATGLAPTWWLAAAAYGLRTLCVYASDPLHTDFTMRAVPPWLRATVNSLTFLTWNVALAGAGWAGGLVISHWGYPVLFALGATVTALAAGSFWLAFRRVETGTRT